MSTEGTLDAEKYAEKETAKPVVVSYPVGAEPSELHPTGIPAGTRTESPSPAIAREFHPEGLIVAYSDGAPYEKAMATRDINSASETPKAEKKTRAKKGSKVAKTEDDTSEPVVSDNVSETVTNDIPGTGTEAGSNLPEDGEAIV